MNAEEYEILKKFFESMLEDDVEMSYSRISRLTEIPVKSGKSKENQLKEWNKIAILSKKGTKFKVERMRTAEELEQYKYQDTMLGLLETCLYSYLCRIDSNVVEMSMSEILSEMELHNQNFKTAKYNIKTTYDLLENEILPRNQWDSFGESDLNSFLSRHENNYRSKIKKILDRMVDRKLIKYDRTLWLGEEYNNITVTKKATTDQEIKYLEVENRCLQKFKVYDEGIQEYRPKGMSELTKEQRWGHSQEVKKLAPKELKCSYTFHKYRIYIEKSGIEYHLVNNLKALKNIINNEVVLRHIENDECRTFIYNFIDIKNVDTNLKQLVYDYKNKKEQI